MADLALRKARLLSDTWGSNPAAGDLLLVQTERESESIYPLLAVRNLTRDNLLHLPLKASEVEFLAEEPPTKEEVGDVIRRYLYAVADSAVDDLLKALA